MRKSALFCISSAVAFLILSFQSAFAQRDFVVHDLEDTILLHTLFDAIKVDTDNVAIWKPNFVESQHFSISDDSLCHTEIDTIIEFQSHGQAIVIFSTNNDDDCHPCSPMLSVASFFKRPQGWEMQEFRKDFEKNGAWGKRQEVSLRRIGKKEYALELDECFGGQGQMSCGISLYDAEYFEPMVTITTSDNDLGMYDNGYSWERTIRFVPGRNKDYYDLVTTIKGTLPKDPDGVKAPLVRVSRTNRYQYENGHYIAAE